MDDFELYLRDVRVKRWVTRTSGLWIEQNGHLSRGEGRANLKSCNVKEEEEEKSMSFFFFF